MYSELNNNLLNYVKNFKVPKKMINPEDRHIILPLQNNKSKEKINSSKPNPSINPQNTITKKNKHRSVGKPIIKSEKSSKHKHHQTSKEVSFYPQNNNIIEQNNNKINFINIEDETKPKKEVKQIIKKKGDKIDYNKVINDLKKQNFLLKDKLSKKEKAIDKYKKKCEEQDENIKSLELILKNLKTNEINNELNDINNYDLLNDISFSNKYDNFKNDFSDNYEKNYKDSFNDDLKYDEEDFAIKAVEQQIMDDLCPNPDAMSYEQLLQLEENVGNVNKGLTNEQIDNLPTKKYRQHIDGDHNKCIICMEEFEEKERVKYLPCNHLFHHNCIRQWLLREKSCPFCKSIIG